tara:strand:+ start:631 stop:1644 length:1014 start_codon:yes stop_codon:yes gene_type:complete
LQNSIDKYIKYAFIILLIFLSYLIFKPYITVIITSLIFAYIAYPVHTWLSKKIRNKTLSSLILTLALILIIIIPVAIIVNIIRIEATDLYLNTDFEALGNFLSNTLDIELSETVQEYLNNGVAELSSFIFEEVSSILLSIPQRFISFLIMLFTFFYAFQDGAKITNAIKNALPISQEYRLRIEKKFKVTIKSLLYGEIAISLLEWIIATLGFYLLGVSSPGLLGLFIGLAALFPGIGPTVIWAPIVIYRYFTGDVLGAVLVGLFGFLILSILLDTVIRAKVLGLKGHIHPLIILIGVVGGLSAFGPLGLLIGPLILVFLELSIEIYIEVKNSHRQRI